MAALLSTIRVTPHHANAILSISFQTLPLLRGHFPATPIVPAVVMLDTMVALAQRVDPQFQLAGVEKAAFRKIVGLNAPQLMVHVKKVNGEKGFQGLICETEGGQIVAEAQLICRFNQAH